MMIPVVLLMILAATAEAAQLSRIQIRSNYVNVTAQLPRFLNITNERLRQAGWTKVKVGDAKVGGAFARGVTIHGLDSVQNQGVAIINSIGSAFEARLLLGLSNLTLSVEQFTLDGLTAPVVFAVKKNAARVSYSVDLQHKSFCTFTWIVFQVYQLDEVTTKSPEPYFDRQDVSTQFQANVVPHLNLFFQSPEFLNLLYEYVNPCKKSGISAPILDRINWDPSLLLPSIETLKNV